MIPQTSPRSLPFATAVRIARAGAFLKLVLPRVWHRRGLANASLATKTSMITRKSVRNFKPVEANDRSAALLHLSREASGTIWSTSYPVHLRFMFRLARMCMSCVNISKEVVAVETGEPQAPQPALSIFVSTVPGSMVWKHSPQRSTKYEQQGLQKFVPFWH